jgi:hypothetical protein
VRQGENWHYHKIIIVIGNDLFLPTNFVTFLKEKLGDILIFFFGFSSASLTNFFLFKKKEIIKILYITKLETKRNERKPWSS